MRIKIKSLEQIREEMQHNNQQHLYEYALNLYESELSVICGQWHNVLYTRHALSRPEYKGYSITAPGSSRLPSYFIVSYLVEEIEED